jgi:hypothetical protein
MVSGIPEQTVERRGSLVFCVSKNSETSPHSGRRGGSVPLGAIEGATQAPLIWAEVDRERMQPLELNERVCGECPIPRHILMENLG